MLICHILCYSNRKLTWMEKNEDHTLLGNKTESCQPGVKQCLVSHPILSTLTQEL